MFGFQNIVTLMAARVAVAAYGILGSIWLALQLIASQVPTTWAENGLVLLFFTSGAIAMRLLWMRSVEKENAAEAKLESLRSELRATQNLELEELRAERDELRKRLEGKASDE